MYIITVRKRRVKQTLHGSIKNKMQPYKAPNVRQRSSNSISPSREMNNDVKYRPTKNKRRLASGTYCKDSSRKLSLKTVSQSNTKDRPYESNKCINDNRSQSPQKSTDKVETNQINYRFVKQERYSTGDTQRLVKTIKRSAGIACCRYNQTKRRYEILLVRKRCSYNYMAFVLGYYSRHDDKRTRFLFNGMTTAEKVDILSLRFDHMWYRAMMYYPDFTSINVDHISKSDVNMYTRRKNKFDQIFGADGGRKIRTLMNDTHNIALMWEIPKGRKNKNEMTVDCAVREFKEETGISSKYYTVISDLTPVNESFINMGTTYVNKYYISMTDIQSDTHINFITNQQPSEIDDIQWMGIQDVRYIDPTSRLIGQVTRIFKAFRTYIKKSPLDSSSSSFSSASDEST
jgi:8-oxo-dGTP pyrophosphatase MutT (NUDIX family)